MSLFGNIPPGKPNQNKTKDKKAENKQLYLKIKLSGPAGWVYTLALPYTKDDFSGKEIVHNERWPRSLKVKVWRKEESVKCLLVCGQRRQECDKGTAELYTPRSTLISSLSRCPSHSLPGSSWGYSRIRWEKHNFLNQYQCFWTCICFLRSLTTESRFNPYEAWHKPVLSWNVCKTYYFFCLALSLSLSN